MARHFALAMLAVGLGTVLFYSVALGAACALVGFALAMRAEARWARARKTAPWTPRLVLPPRKRALDS